MAQVPTVVIQPLNYDHKFPWHGTAEGGDDFIGQSRVTQLIKQGRSLLAAGGAAQPEQQTWGWLTAGPGCAITVPACSDLQPKSLHLLCSSAEVTVVALWALPDPVSGPERAAGQPQEWAGGWQGNQGQVCLLLYLL